MNHSAWPRLQPNGRYHRRMAALSRTAASLLWVLFVCYPDPRVLGRSIKHTLRPPVDPDAVREWARTLPDDPGQIEQAVHERVQYAIPWHKDKVPWTFPAPAEILRRGYGDCQCRAIVLASVLTAKGIPHQLRASVDHMWVDYPGKESNDLENDAMTFWTRAEPDNLAGPEGVEGAESGHFRFRLPAIDWAESFRIEKEYFWDAAPLSRRLLLLAGLGVIWLWGR
jgi:hypothetical protein